MNNDLHITATVDEPYLLENLVERLAGRHYATGCCEEKMPVGLKAIESSTVEVYISGYVEFDNNGGGSIEDPLYYVICLYLHQGERHFLPVELEYLTFLTPVFWCTRLDFIPNNNIY